MNDKKETKESKGLKELKQDLKARSKELEKAKREYDMEQLSEKISCLPSLILQNEPLSKLILDLPNDETRIIFKEMIGSGEFTVLVEKIIENSVSLKKAQERKQVKAEARKRKAVVPNQAAASEQTVVPEQSAAPEQPVVSEQTAVLEQPVVPEQSAVSEQSVVSEKEYPEQDTSFISNQQNFQA
ncbi:MAG: hypothetical protein K2K57_09400 [Oscillospiraceae bacterium]|nr:hypothetical protein [Oscillospiraceae bacterium]